MATIYVVEIVSHWVNYTDEELQKILEQCLIQKEREKINMFTIKVNPQNT